MERYLRIPLVFLAVASALGVILRLQAVAPVVGINYKFFLHGHSHVMFLGWVFNVLYLAFVMHHIAQERQRIFRIVFLVLQVLNVGMLISFPLEGYGLYSISFSTIHTVVSIAFIMLFFKRAQERTQSLWLAKLSLMFFMVASAGPFTLAYIMANGLQATDWYNYAIYFYLHFQYNGCFLFGIGSLFTNRVEATYASQTGILKPLWKWLAIATVPSYVLSILYSEPGVMFNVIGGLSAFIQCVVTLRLWLWLTQAPGVIGKSFPEMTAYLHVVFVALVLKHLLQLLSAVPFFANLAFELRPIVIAYLHLALVGVISVFILIWYHANGIFSRPFSRVLAVFLIAFVIMEITLVLMPWWPSAFHAMEPSFLLLITAVILFFSCAVFFGLYRRRRTDVG